MSFLSFLLLQKRVTEGDMGLNLWRERYKKGKKGEFTHKDLEGFQNHHSQICAKPNQTLLHSTRCLGLLSLSAIHLQKQKRNALFNPPKPITLFLRHHYHSSFLNLHPHPLNVHHPSIPLLKPISATKSFPSSPSPSPPSTPNQIYQPFLRPSPPQTPSLSFDAIIDVLRNRLGIWYEYAPLIPTLTHHHSFFPSAIEESTGISGVEQNRLLVAAQVRDSILSSSLVAAQVSDSLLSSSLVAAQVRDSLLSSGMGVRNG